MGNIVHVIASLVGAGLLAWPFWAFWTLSGFGRTYFKSLPTEWQEMGLLDCTSLLITVSIIRCVAFPKHASVTPTAVVPGIVNGHARQGPLWFSTKLLKGNRLGDRRSVFSTKLQPGVMGNKDGAPAVGEATKNSNIDNAAGNDPSDLSELVDLWAKLSAETRSACLAMARDSVVKLG